MADTTADQEVAARELLGWSRDDLARAAHLREVTVARFESGARTSYGPTLARIRATVEAQGIEFTEGAVPGAKLEPSPPQSPPWL